MMRIERDAVVMLLAGGQGSRLSILGQARAKPAMPFGGIYRIIDFTLSNVMNSGLAGVGILTQYKPYSLMAHIGTGLAWDFLGYGREARVLPPHTGETDSDWYKGTADAVWQNWSFVRNRRAPHVLIVSGDHIYQMDYSRMLRFHVERGADVTLAGMIIDPAQCRHFGMITADRTDRVLRFDEKPESTRSRIASMGVYVFSTNVLEEELETIVKPRKGFDFGKDLLPHCLERRAVYAYPFDGYWRDVGTIESYFDTHMDLLDPASGLRPETWRIYTNPQDRGLEDRPPARIAGKARVTDSLISRGCIIRGKVERSVLSPGVVVEEGAHVSESVILHDARIESGARVDRCIVDKDAAVGKDAHVGAGKAAPPNRAHPQHLTARITLIGKGAQIPPGTKIGRHCVVRAWTRAEHFAGSTIAAGDSVGPE